jgi:hypothetical protein
MGTIIEADRWAVGTIMEADRCSGLKSMEENGRPSTFYRECDCGVTGPASTFMAILTRSWLVWAEMSRQLAVNAMLRFRGREQEQEGEQKGGC